MMGLEPVAPLGAEDFAGIAVPTELFNRNLGFVAHPPHTAHGMRGDGRQTPGRHKQSIAACLKLSRAHVSSLVASFAECQRWAPFRSGGKTRRPRRCRQHNAWPAQALY